MRGVFVLTMFVLVAHGSRDARWRESLQNLTDSLKAGPPSRDIQLAFMQFDGPTLPDVIEKGVGRGVREFRLLPLFMASAGHVDKDIRPLVEELEGLFPGVACQMHCFAIQLFVVVAATVRKASITIVAFKHVK